MHLNKGKSQKDTLLYDKLMTNPQISTTYARDRADDFDAVRRALTGRKFTAEGSLRLRDLIRLQTVPEPSAKISEAPPEPTAVTHSYPDLGGYEPRPKATDFTGSQWEELDR